MAVTSYYRRLLRLFFVLHGFFSLSKSAFGGCSTACGAFLVAVDFDGDRRSSPPNARKEELPEK